MKGRSLSYKDQMGKDDSSVRFVVLTTWNSMAGIVPGWKWGEFRRQAAPGSLGHFQREWLYYGMKHIDACDQNYILKDQSPCL